MSDAVSKEEVAWFLDDLFKSTPDVRAQVIGQLRREQVISDDGSTFFCERLGCALVVPCHLGACDYHVRSAPNRNCLLSVRKSERNEYMDVAKALGCDESEARQKIAEAFTQLRAASLLEALDAANVNRYTLLPGTGVCVVCGGVSETPYHEVDGYTYCRKECYREKPQNLLAAECLYRADVRSILRVALTTFKQIPLIASALRIPRQSLLRHYEYYLGIKPASFGIDVADIVDLLRLTKHAPTDDFIVVQKDDLARYPKWQRLEEMAGELARTL